jgi:hypothetical protein
MLNSLNLRLGRINIFEDILKDDVNSADIEEDFFREEDDKFDQAGLFKIPKYLEKVNKFQILKF